MKAKGILFSAPMVNAIANGRKTQTRRLVKPQPQPFDENGCRLREIAPTTLATFGFDARYDPGNPRFIKPPYAKGDLLYVKETWADVNSDYGPSLAYRADHAVVGWEDFSTTFGEDEGAGPSFDYETYKGDWCMWYSDLFAGSPDHHWRSSMSMPKWAARLWLTVTSVRVERLGDISPIDALEEGIQPGKGNGAPQPGFYVDYYGFWGDDNYDAFCEAQERSIVAGFESLWDSINGPGSWERDKDKWVWVVEFEKTERREVSA